MPLFAHQLTASVWRKRRRSSQPAPSKAWWPHHSAASRSTEPERSLAIPHHRTWSISAVSICTFQPLSCRSLGCPKPMMSNMSIVYVHMFDHVLVQSNCPKSSCKLLKSFCCWKETLWCSQMPFAKPPHCSHTNLSWTPHHANGCLACQPNTGGKYHLLHPLRFGMCGFPVTNLFCISNHLCRRRTTGSTLWCCRGPGWRACNASRKQIWQRLLMVHNLIQKGPTWMHITSFELSSQNALEGISWWC